MIVIFRALDIEVWYPAQLTIDISILGNRGVVWHSRALHIIHFVWVELSSWLNKNLLLILEALVKVLLVVGVILLVENGGGEVMSFVPLVIIRRKHTIIGVLVDDDLGSSLCTIGISTLELGMCSKDVGKSFAPQRRLSIDGCDRWSQLRVNYNVFCVGHII